MIDIHNHLFINVDDGPSSKKEVLNLLNQAVQQGITHVICTPHHHSGSYKTPAGVVEKKIVEVRKIAQKNGLNIELHPGQEIRINDHIIKELKSGESIPLNDTRYVLVEFSFTELRSDVHEILTELKSLGYIPIIAHPERCRPIARDADHLQKIVSDGAKAQVTAGSVTGELGTGIQEMSLEWIEQGLIHIVASDAHHASYRPFLLKDALDIIETRLGREVRDRLLQNAEAVVNDEVFE